MTLAINASSAVYTSYGHVKPGPKAVPAVEQETSATTGASGAPATSAAAETFGATIAAEAAQDPQPGAQGSDGADGPGRDPGLQGEETIFGDLNGDSSLDRDDVDMLLKAFNSSIASADLNDDGAVNTADLGILISAIREFNSKSRPDLNPGDGPDRDLRPLSAVPVERERFGQIDAVGLSEDDRVSQHTQGGSVKADAPTQQPGVFGDLTGDGIVDSDDLAVLKDSFGSKGAVGDLNGDGRVDTADLGSLLGLMNRPESA